MTVIAGVSTAPRTVAAVIHLVVGTTSLAFAARALKRGPHPPPKAEDVGPLNDFLTRHKWAMEIIVPGGFEVYLVTLGPILLP